MRRPFSPEPLTRLVRFPATDGVELSGLLYEPKGPGRRAIVWLHGTGGATVFESSRTNLLARAFSAAGFAFFPFNNRGAHLAKWFRVGRRRVGGGMAYEKIRDCVFDIDGAARELRRRGYRELWLAGHSTGANKVAVYDSRRERTPFRGYVLLAGGDDTGMLWQRLGERRLRAALDKARARIRAGRGDELVPRSISSMLLSWRSLYDMANPDGDYNVFPFLEAMRGVRLGRKAHFRHVRGIRKPALFLYGDADEYLYGDVPRCMAILAGALGGRPNAEIAVLRDADHGFGGREKELAEVIVNWLA